nr:uncharacterized protein LOC109181052 [Ipomoea batatas]
MSERQDFLPKKDQEKEIQSQIQIRPASHDPKGCPNIAPSRHLSHLQELPGAGGDGDEDDDNRKNQKKNPSDHSVSASTQEKLQAQDFAGKEKSNNRRAARSVGRG